MPRPSSLSPLYALLCFSHFTRASAGTRSRVYECDLIARNFSTSISFYSINLCLCVIYFISWMIYFRHFRPFTDLFFSKKLKMDEYVRRQQNKSGFISCCLFLPLTIDVTYKYVHTYYINVCIVINARLFSYDERRIVSNPNFTYRRNFRSRRWLRWLWYVFLRNVLWKKQNIIRNRYISDTTTYDTYRWW